MGWIKDLLFMEIGKTAKMGIKGLSLKVNPSDSEDSTYQRNLARFNTCKLMMKKLKPGTERYRAFESEYYVREGFLKSHEVNKRRIK